jgi:hypothetical protein
MLALLEFLQGVNDRLDAGENEDYENYENYEYECWVSCMKTLRRLGGKKTLAIGCEHP